MGLNLQNAVRSLLLSAVLIPAVASGAFAEDAGSQGTDPGVEASSATPAEQSAPASTSGPSGATGGGNIANFRQQGFANFSSISQQGRGNIAVGLQSGKSNQVDVSQEGANNVATTVQIGDGFSRTVEQSGNKLSSTSFQVQNRAGVTSSGSRTQNGVSIGYETK
jgi:hypothetical protein